MFLQGVNVALQACNSESLSVKLLGQLIILPLQITLDQLWIMHSSSLIQDYEFQIFELLLLQFQLLSESTGFNLQITDLLGHELLILFKLRAHSLEAFFIVFIIHL